MNEKTISKYIDALSEKLGVAAEHIYGTLYKQSITVGITELLFSILLIVVLVVSAKFVINIFTKGVYEKEEGRYYPSLEPVNTYAKIEKSDFVDDGFLWWIAIPVWICMIIILAITLPDGILRLLNPEYYALKEILSVFSK